MIPGLGRFPREGNGYPLQYSCLGGCHGQRSMAGYSPWGCKESARTDYHCHHRGQLPAMAMSQGTCIRFWSVVFAYVPSPTLSPSRTRSGFIPHQDAPCRVLQTDVLVGLNYTTTSSMFTDRRLDGAFSTQGLVPYCWWDGGAREPCRSACLYFLLFKIKTKRQDFSQAEFSPV